MSQDNDPEPDPADELNTERLADPTLVDADWKAIADAFFRRYDVPKRTVAAEYGRDTIEGNEWLVALYVLEYDLSFPRGAPGTDGE